MYTISAGEEGWVFGGVAQKSKLIDHEMTDQSTWGSPVRFPGFRKLLTAIQKEFGTPSTHNYLPTSRYSVAIDEFYQAFPCISTASDKCWGEK